MNKTLNVILKTPYSVVYEGEVQFVRLKTELGMMMVYPNHANLNGYANFSAIRVRTDNDKEQIKFNARNLIINVSNENNTVTLLATECQKTKELTMTSAKEYLELVNKQLSEGKDMSNFHLKYIKGEKFLLEQQIKELEEQQV